MPAPSSGIARRYAEAVFQIARARGSFDGWTTDLAALSALEEEPKVARVLSNPAVGMSAKEAILAEFSTGLSPEARTLARLLLHKGRLALAPQVADHYRRMLNQHRGIAMAEVTSAVPLKPGEVETVARRLAAMTGRKQVMVETEVDPAIIGGIVARIGDQLIDASVRGRLEALRKQLVGEL